MRQYGTIVCNGLTIPIVAITLEHNEIMFHGCLTEPGNHDYVVDGPYTVFGEDGTGLFQGGWEKRAVYKCRRGGSLLIALPLRITAEEPAVIAATA